MNNVYLLLGSNLSDPHEQLQIARKHITTHIGKVIKQSSIYKTAAWGDADQPDFLNQVLFIKTKSIAEKILEKILEIERQMGRIRTKKNAPRIIDIDILFYNQDIKQANQLTIPHPEIQNRRFVLVPMNELSPRLVHPVLKKTIQTLLSECPDKLDVKKI